MPQCNGPDMVRNIRGIAEGEKVPVIMMTSIVKSYKLEREALNKWGANAYLQKPFEMPNLLEGTGP